MTEKGVKETFLNHITMKEVTDPSFRVFVDDKQLSCVPYRNPMKWLMQRYRDHMPPPRLP